MDLPADPFARSISKSSKNVICMHVCMYVYIYDCKWLIDRSETFAVKFTFTVGRAC